jgi:hypothetical protein
MTFEGRVRATTSFFNNLKAPVPRYCYEFVCLIDHHVLAPITLLLLPLSGGRPLGLCLSMDRGRPHRPRRCNLLPQSQLGSAGGHCHWNLPHSYQRCHTVNCELAQFSIWMP